MSEFYNYDGVVVPYGPMDDKPFGKACMRQGYLVFKISDKVYPQAKSSAFPLDGVLVNETMDFMNDNMVINGVLLRCDQAPSATPAGTFDITVWGTDDPVNPTVSNFYNVASVSPFAQQATGQVYSLSNVGLSPKLIAEPKKFIVIEGDMASWVDYKATLFLDFAEA